jgi:serine/threonine protein kinase
VLRSGDDSLNLASRSILLTDENVPKLSDFCASEIFGKPPNLPSPALMAPECVLSGVGTASEASQVYRVGALIYEMLTARPPFVADNVLATLKRVLHDVPEPPRQVNTKAGIDLEAVCMKCLRKRPEARYTSLHELAGDLKPFLQSRKGSEWSCGQDGPTSG